jgi:ABC-2 type transport system permease protein
VLALIRADGLTALSYRLETAVSLAGLLVSIVPVYFIAQALQPVMAKAIATEGHQYFGFLVVGMIAFTMLMTAVSALPDAVRSGIDRGTFEALLATPTPLPALVAGLTGYSLIWTLARGALLLTAAWALGTPVAWDRALVALGILLLIVLAYLPFAILTAALILAFRTTGRLPQAVLALSGLLGGVYYPTQVIPSWLQRVSEVIPLTYGLRALRRSVLDGAQFGAIATDLAMLALSAVVLFGISLFAFSQALRHARRAGTLAQY